MLNLEICLTIIAIIMLVVLLFRRGATCAYIDQLEESLRQELARQQSSQSGEARALREELVKLMRELSGTLSESLEKMRGENAEKLEQMRRTVDEKLHETLEKRLGESFEQVSKRLEEVSRGLGEMQQLATGVGDLKRVLTNVKSRGTWGEYQLEAIISETLTVEQYGRNVKTNPHSHEIVEFAIKLPGKEDGCAPVWLPIDSKFPKEDYERLQQAVEQADKAGAELALRQLQRRVKDSAKEITKYLAPPHTTDFGIMFLPVEGLYAEVLRSPGLVDEIQRLYRITIAGPTTLTALLNSLQMGFRTLAIEKRSSEVWQVLGAVKSEFLKFGRVFESVQRKIEDADKILKSAEIRTRAMNRKLRNVEMLPESVSAEILEGE